jgi:hypothetical protein
MSKAAPPTMLSKVLGSGMRWKWYAAPMGVALRRSSANAWFCPKSIVHAPASTAARKRKRSGLGWCDRGRAGMMINFYFHRDQTPVHPRLQPLFRAFSSPMSAVEIISGLYPMSLIVSALRLRLDTDFMVNLHPP